MIVVAAALPDWTTGYDLLIARLTSSRLRKELEQVVIRIVQVADFEPKTVYCVLTHFEKPAQILSIAKVEFAMQ
jgi:hypothetical protein